MRTLLIVTFGFLAATQASVILLNSGNIDTYMTLNMTEHGDVALSTCPMVANPVADCDTEGTATMVITRSVFEANLPLAVKYDKVTAEAKEYIRVKQARVNNVKKELKANEAKIADAQLRKGKLEEKIAILNKQIQDVESRLQDPNIDPDDKKELEAFLLKARTDKRALETELTKVQKELAGYESLKKQQLESISYIEKEIADTQTKIQNRKSFLENKAIELMANLEQKQLTTVYEKESLYFLAYFIFDSANRVVDDAGCTVEASFNGSFNNVRATVKLTEGVFPKIVSLGNTKISLYDGATLDLTMSSLGVKGWSKGDLFEFKSPRTKSQVVCDDSNGIAGAKNVSWVKTHAGSLNNDTKCNGKSSRRYVTIAMYYVGRMNAKSTAEVCAGLNPLEGRDITTVPLNQQFYQGNYFEGVHIQELFKSSPVLSSLKVEGHPYLTDGYYTMASNQKPYVWEFTAEKAKVIDFTKTEHEKTIFDWELPAMCYLRVNADYCD